jgi:hypothetical protein
VPDAIYEANPRLFVVRDIMRSRRRLLSFVIWGLPAKDLISHDSRLAWKKDVAEGQFILLFA